MTPLSPADEQLAGTDRGRHLPGRRQCANCPKMAAIRRMHRGPDGRLYGSGCARKLGIITPRPPRRSTLNSLGARIIPGTLFDQPAREQPAMSQPTTTARRFVIERGDTRILDGVLWPDGSCSLRWRQTPRSFVSWDDLDECIQINVTGVPGAVLVWVDPEAEAQQAAPAVTPELSEAPAGYPSPDAE